MEYFNYIKLLGGQYSKNIESFNKNAEHEQILIRTNSANTSNEIKAEVKTK